MLSADMSTWNTLLVNRTRVWDKPMLDAAITHRGSLLHVSRLLDKLRSGKRVVATMFGSSFVQDFAGCWQPSLQAVWDVVLSPHPLLYPHPSAHASFHGADLIRRVWL